MVDDPWLHVRRDAMLGELARIQHRFDDAVSTSVARAASRPARLPADRGVPGLESRAGAVPGRRLRGRRRHPELAIEKAEATGDVRMAALARVHLGRVAARARAGRRGGAAALESATAWHRAAGGGEQAALGECLLAAMDGDTDRLREILAASPEPHVAVFALDALGLH